MTYNALFLRQTTPWSVNRVEAECLLGPPTAESVADSSETGKHEIAVLSAIKSSGGGTGFTSQYRPLGITRNLAQALIYFVRRNHVIHTFLLEDVSSRQEINQAIETPHDAQD
jgi:hypothetical protein